MPIESRELSEIESNLRAAVRHLSEDIGPRSCTEVAKLDMAADYIEEGFLTSGCAVGRQRFVYRSNGYWNVIAEVKGKEERDGGILVIGAHYDTVAGTPGADDNASGVAGLLELARLAALNPFRRTARFVAFSLEEPPVFMTSRMGSHIYAESLRDEGAEVFGMVSLEMLGYYCDRADCQFYPASLFKWFYPHKGDFIAFVGNVSSKHFTEKLKSAFRSASSMPVESLNAWSIIPGVDFSDHRSFWKFGYPACMITDTAFYRNPNYHGPGDSAETLDYRKMAELVAGLYKAFASL
ncbi:MAG TPA: M28 family peptidase [Thermodesulfovibrionales bacterium]|nr:M28 family peptidase [Thermodesulfovibrionales bacterium]